MGATPQQAYVWVWLPGAVDPVVAGRLRADGEVLTFTYGRSYLERPDAVPLYLPELPLRRGTIAPRPPLAVAGCLRDAAPDAWGQRVILARHVGRLGPGHDTASLGLLSYLLESGSDRIGALDFQTDASRYVPRLQRAELEELFTAAARLDAGEALPTELAQALLHGTSIGGARPKALLHDTGSGALLIAKFSTASDPYPVVKAEAVAMDLARRVGLDVAATSLTRCLGRHVLLVERFDRRREPHGVTRRMLVSALTLFGLDELAARWATYGELADLIRARFTAPDATLRELFGRIVFNVCISNTDDHARNHAAFFDPRPGGVDLTLTPAYDLCPQPRSGHTANQAMAIDRGGRRASRLRLCRESAALYHLTDAEAADIIEHQLTVIGEQWPDAAERAELTAVERAALWGRQILNPAIHFDD
ncbi:MAG: type II toxin-antitoxin system HipA family toxin [Acidimicrobiales bacterium]